MSEVTAMLAANGNGGALASERLLPLVYEELRRLAAARMMKELPGQTLQPTALVHEAWLRLIGKGECSWQNRAHFFGAAAQAMRRILVDRSRSRAAIKRRATEDAPGSDMLTNPTEDHILMIHESLKRLEQEDPEAARIVLLKFFSGLGSEEIARMNSCSVRSVERQWTMAKARLYQMIREEGFHRDLKAS
ncbi:ECF-type sigma factor [Haloferula sp. BvORR071]|uniref:ECF-type sigma factor n=1 Tax=Haloferula sp. BvORR071 TaxID=1396141 RepID=UPI0005530096|nr:ECF-type sigma factor [Haloferula sp. BvORR071]